MIFGKEPPFLSKLVATQDIPKVRNFILRLNIFIITNHLKNPAINIPVVLLSSSVKIWGKSVKGFKIYDWTYKEINEQTEITT